jgi:hypothetical protein
VSKISHPRLGGTMLVRSFWDNLEARGRIPSLRDTGLGCV